MILADSNLIIYAASGNYPDLLDWFAENQPVASAVSLLEALGYYKLTAKEKSALEALFAELTVLYPTTEIFKIAVDLRQQRSVSVGDALIAATAIHHNLTLATHNTKDFEWIKSLSVI
ncbi:MAG: type II toxin-antitoxin system VapC family toxin, partial [Nitrospirae bacterium]|nr:type II toxin-antitoxin system VapC family toxin [Nitrospirota bacterium]